MKLTPHRFAGPLQGPLLLAALVLCAAFLVSAPLWAGAPALLGTATVADATPVLADAADAEEAAPAPAAAAPAQVEARVDGERSTLRFTSTAPAERIVGTAGELSGTLRFPPQNPEAVSGTIRFPVSSMRTGNNLRDRHLLGSDWLEADAHPEIVFTIASVDVRERNEADGRINLEGEARGTLLMRGVEQEVRAPVEVALLTETGRVRVSFRLDANIVAHGLPGRRNSIGREVAEVIQVEGTVYGGWE